MIRKTVCLCMALLLLFPTLVMAKPGGKHEDLEDILMTTLSPSITNAVNGYYGSPREYGLYDAKIIKTERITEGSYGFKVTVQVKTFVGPHNPPFGLETITFYVSPGKTLVENFVHKDYKQKPGSF